MKKSLTALALALTLVGSLAACSTENPDNNNTGNNGGTASGAVGGTTGGSASGSPGTVSRRYGGQSVYNGRTYFDDGRYAAGSNGQVYGNNSNSVTRDLTRDARDIVRDTGDAIGDIGRGIGDAARDITGMGNSAYSGTPSWEPDSSAVRY